MPASVASPRGRSGCQQIYCRPSADIRSNSSQGLVTPFLPEAPVCAVSIMHNLIQIKMADPHRYPCDTPMRHQTSSCLRPFRIHLGAKVPTEMSPITILGLRCSCDFEFTSSLCYSKPKRNLGNSISGATFDGCRLINRYLLNPRLCYSMLPYRKHP